MSSVRAMAPGLSIAILIAVISWFLGKSFPIIGGPVIGLLLGLFVSTFIPLPDQYTAGIQFTSKKVLQYAVVLLGFGLNFSQVFKVGLSSLPIILTTITTALVTAFLLCRLLKIDNEIATLIGVGSSICGGSAIAATAPIIRAKDENISTAISAIFFFNILAALVFPQVGDYLGLTNHGFALFAGTAVNDTSSVTATASSWDSIHNSSILEEATVVKLTRTLAILPITIGLSFYQENHSHHQQSKTSLVRVIPNFLIVFLFASLITTLGTHFGLNANVFTPLKNLSKFLIIMAMAAIGYQTNIKNLIKKGGAALLVGALCWLMVSLSSLFMQKLLGLW